MSASPDGLGVRGSALWESLARDANSADGVLALEACRAADRLDELDRIIRGEGVAELMRFRRVDQHGDGTAENPVVIEVKFDNVLGEARQQQANLRSMLVSLGLKAAGVSLADVPASTVDEFTQRRERRAK